MGLGGGVVVVVARTAELGLSGRVERRRFRVGFRRRGDGGGGVADVVFDREGVAVAVAARDAVVGAAEGAGVGAEAARSEERGVGERGSTRSGAAGSTGPTDASAHAESEGVCARP